MRHFLFLTLTLLFFSLEASVLDYSLDQIILRFRSKLQQKCNHIGGENAFAELQVATSELLDCIPINFNAPDTICTDQRLKSYQCYVHFLDKLLVCLESQEKYFKNWFLNSHDSVFDRICKTDVETFLQTKTKFENSICKTPLHDIAQKYLHNCLSKLTILKNLYKQDDVITEEDLCQDISNMRYCHVTDIKDHCTEHDSMKRMFNLLFDSYLDSCKIDLSMSQNTP